MATLPTRMDDGVVAEWLMARKVVMDFLKELQPNSSQETIEHNAAALIARLAGHNPPILLSIQS